MSCRPAGEKANYKYFDAFLQTISNVYVTLLFFPMENILGGLFITSRMRAYYWMMAELTR